MIYLLSGETVMICIHMCIVQCLRREPGIPVTKKLSNHPREDKEIKTGNFPFVTLV